MAGVALFTAVAGVAFTAVAVASMVEWVGFTAGAAGEDTVAAGGSARADTVAAGADTVAATIQGTGLVFPVTGLITVPDGVILTTVILILILTRLIHTQFLIRIHIMANAYTGPDQAYCPQANGRPLYLIKLTYNNQVWMSQDYWYTSDTLNFITPQGQQNKTPIRSIDRDATYRLNAGCGLNFQWP